MPSLKVLIVHGRAPVRAAIRVLLEQIGGIEVVGEAKDVVGLLRLIPHTVRFGQYVMRSDWSLQLVAEFAILVVALSDRVNDLGDL